MNRKRNKSMRRSVGSGSRILWILKSLLISYVVTALLLFIMAALLYKFDLDERAVSAGIVAIYVLSALIGGVMLGKMVPQRRFLWGLLLGASYFMVLILITIGVYREIDTTGIHLLTTFALCAGGGMLGGMIS